MGKNSSRILDEINLTYSQVTVENVRIFLFVSLMLPETNIPLLHLVILAGVSITAQLLHSVMFMDLY